MRQKTVNRWAIAGTLLSLLSACGGGSGGAGPGPLPEKKLLNADNYLDASAVAVLAYTRSQSLPGQIIAPGFQLLLNQKETGVYPCEGGGSLQLTRNGGAYDFAADHCKSAAIELQSGRFQIQSLNGMSYTFTDLMLQLTGDSQSLKVNGSLKSDVVGQVSSTSGNLVVERNNKADRYTDYKITAPAFGSGETKLVMTIDSPRSPTSLTASATLNDAQLSATITAKDNSQITLVLAKDASLKLELREQANTPVLQTRNLSASETEALLKKIQE